MSSAASDSGGARAACLTAPAAGGVAVVQVAGPDAATIVQQFLESKRPIDLQNMEPGELRLCRWRVGDEVVDDALVCVRRTPAGSFVVDVSVHGGPRIVQRVLMALREAGARVVPPRELTDATHDGSTMFVREVMDALLRAKTRAVASWLVRLIEFGPATIDETRAMIERGETGAVRTQLRDMSDGIRTARYLLDGVRCVLVGEPNAGKSTLANALAEREQAVVSETAGTTRDWIEHPGAVAGVPFTFVDTAGLRDTADELEREAIRRSRAQLERADVVIHVLDGSREPTQAERQAVSASNVVSVVQAFVWNKSDLPLNAAHRELIGRAGDRVVKISARTGEGIAEVRERLIDDAGMSNWEGRPPLIFRDRHVRVIADALSALDGSEKGGRAASGLLASFIEV